MDKEKKKQEEDSKKKFADVKSPQFLYTHYRRKRKIKNQEEQA